MEPFDWSPYLAAPDEEQAAVHARWLAVGFADGLPLVPPTPARVRQIYREARLDPVRGVAIVEPALRAATVYDLAVCACAAGCTPAALPLLVAAVRAVAEPSFNLLGIQTTTGTATVAIIAHGPAATRAGVSGGRDCLGGSTAANATIGRALRFVLRALGGASPGTMDAATMGQPAKLGLCFAENLAASPWPPLDASRGILTDGASAVTVVGIAGTVEVVVAEGDAQELLEVLAATALMPGNAGSHGMIGGGSPLFVLSPEHAAILAAEGMDRGSVQARLWELAALPLVSLPATMAARIRRGRQGRGADPETPLRIAERAEDLLVAVAGGIGVKSSYMPSWGGGTRAVTLALER